MLLTFSTDRNLQKLILSFKNQFLIKRNKLIEDNR